MPVTEATIAAAAVAPLRSDAGEMPGRIGMAAEAEHDIEQDDADVRVGERLPQAAHRAPPARSSDAAGRA